MKVAAYLPDDLAAEARDNLGGTSISAACQSALRVYPRGFAGFRPSPPQEYAGKGITNSGTGPDYEGAVFSDGTVVIRWMTQYRSHSVWACWDDFCQVHGHPEYGTVIVFADGGDPP